MLRVVDVICVPCVLGGLGGCGRCVAAGGYVGCLRYVLCGRCERKRVMCAILCYVDYVRALDLSMRRRGVLCMV